MDFSLHRIKDVAEKLKIINREEVIITVAGTNGKGSTVAFLESILVEHGYKVGSYTSPHVIKYNERIKINKEPVTDEEICQAFDEIDKIRKDTSLTYFEFATLASLLIFKKNKIDVVILEVGLGGRLDAVNIIDPNISVITNIGMDHEDILGNDLESIAYEKAGIMRQSGVTVVGFSDAQISIINRSLELENKLFTYKSDYWFEPKSNHWLFNNNDSNLFRLDYPSLKGNIQLNNCATAIQTLTLLREITLDEKTINEAIKKTKILGRFDEINFAGKKVILDIAHNPQSVSFLKENLKKYYPNSEFIAVFSALEDKNVCSMIEELNGTINQWNISEINNERKTDIQDIEIALKRAKQKYKTYKNVTQSFNNAISDTDAKSVVVVFGSFYMVEEIYKYLDYKNERLNS